MYVIVFEMNLDNKGCIYDIYRRKKISKKYKSTWKAHLGGNGQRMQ